MYEVGGARERAERRSGVDVGGEAVLRGEDAGCGVPSTVSMESRAMARRDCVVGEGERDGALVGVCACVGEGGDADELVLPAWATEAAVAGAPVAFPGVLRSPGLLTSRAAVLPVSCVPAAGLRCGRSGGCCVVFLRLFPVVFCSESGKPGFDPVDPRRRFPVMVACYIPLIVPQLVPRGRLTQTCYDWR